jgi:hypothetical protein
MAVGIVTANAYPHDYHEDGESAAEIPAAVPSTELESLRVPSFLSFMNTETMAKRKFAIAGAVAFAVIASVAAIGVPAGWYGRAKASAVVIQPNTVAVTEAPTPELVVPTESSQPSDHSEEEALAARRQHEKEKDKAKARQEKAAGALTSAASSSVPTTVETAKSGAKKITVTVTYDESGRVTQASGGDASAVRIARQKRFPVGKAGSATITIPIN